MPAAGDDQDRVAIDGEHEAVRDRAHRAAQPLGGDRRGGHGLVEGDDLAPDTGLAQRPLVLRPGAVVRLGALRSLHAAGS
ncbi:hypothetical protein GCM10027174_07520 [Salinifilum aidingensis]